LKNDQISIKLKNKVVQKAAKMGQKEGSEFYGLLPKAFRKCWPPWVKAEPITIQTEAFFFK
jgi:hypothetical protein